jgi:hypothetical protein
MAFGEAACSIRWKAVASKRLDYGMTYALPAVKDEIAVNLEVEAMQKR